MTRAYRSACLAACLGLAACPGHQGESTIPQAANAVDSDLLARGRYLVMIGGCNDCHTPGYGEKSGNVPEREWLVGTAVGYHGPWGTTYAANLRLKLADMDEAAWLAYSSQLHTRPIMPDYNVRAMNEGDRRAIYRYVRSLGPAGEKAPDYLPPDRQPPPPYFDLVLPAANGAGAAARPTG